MVNIDNYIYRNPLVSHLVLYAKKKGICLVSPVVKSPMKYSKYLECF